MYSSGGASSASGGSNLPVPYRSVVYCAVNKANGKRYVGKTTNWPVRRTEHRKRKRTHFGNAIRKHGVEGFRWDILYADADDSALARAEAAFIALYGCRGEAGYNLTDGGEGSPGRVHSEETKQRIAATHAKRVADGVWKGGKGRKHSLETRRRMSEAHKGRKITGYRPITVSRKVTDVQIAAMIRLRQQGRTLKSIGAEIGVSHVYVHLICTGKTRRSPFWKSPQG